MYIDLEDRIKMCTRIQGTDIHPWNVPAVRQIRQGAPSLGSGTASADSHGPVDVDAWGRFASQHKTGPLHQDSSPCRFSDDGPARQPRATTSYSGAGASSSAPRTKSSRSCLDGWQGSLADDPCGEYTKVRCSSISQNTEHAKDGSDYHLKVIVDSRAMNVPSWDRFLAVDQAFTRQ